MLSTPLDRIDRAIIYHLQNTARLSNKELAAKVGLAPSSCLERVRRLRARNILGDARTQVDPTALGVGLEAMVHVRLADHTRVAVDTFLAAMGALPHVVHIYEVSGRYDYLVHLAVSGPEQLRNLRMDAFTARADVDQIETSLIFAHRQGSYPDLLTD